MEAETDRVSQRHPSSLLFSDPPAAESQVDGFGPARQVIWRGLGPFWQILPRDRAVMEQPGDLPEVYPEKRQRPRRQGRASEDASEPQGPANCRVGCN